jgi:hypothetical protein
LIWEETSTKIPAEAFPIVDVTIFVIQQLERHQDGLKNLSIRLFSGKPPQFWQNLITTAQHHYNIDFRVVDQLE